MSAPLVVKIGGSTLGSTDTSFRDIAKLAQRGDVPIVVHGGGAEATRWLDAMGIESRFEQGRRVTDDRALPVIVAVFAGLVNKRIVAAINAAGARAVGLSGADGRTLECDMRDPALGFVGEPREVHPEAIVALREAGMVPVLSPVGFVPGEDADQLVNVNADTVAGSIAAAVGARKLVFLTDIDGVRRGDGSVIPELTGQQARELIRAGVATGGMIPKIDACLHALELGVPVQIVDGRVPGILAGDLASGTRFA
jgi:acetylglutamate kinase